MKVQSATVKVCLITAKRSKSGECAIVIRVQYNGRKDKHLGIKIEPKYWDAKNEQIKRLYPNSVELNRIIQEAKKKILDRKYEYEVNNTPYTAAMLLDDSRNIKPDLCGNSIILKQLVGRLILERRLKPNTIKTYKLMLNLIERYSGKSSANLILTEIDEKFCISFCKWMKNNIGDRNKAEGTINAVCSKIASVWNYAIENKLISSDLYPFRRFKYNTEYRQSEKKKSLNNDCITIMEASFSQYMIVDPVSGTMRYKGEHYAKLLHRHTEEFALAMYILGFRLQGLAFADLARVKIDDVSEEKHGEDVYYVFNHIRRSKTNEPVPIVLKKDAMGLALMECFIYTANNREGYLFPILQNDMHAYNYDTDEKISHALDTAERMVNKNLKKYARRINSERGEEVIPTDITFYSMRHTFATLYMNNPNANPVHLATMMGRSVNGIYRYVKSIQSVKDIISEREKIFDTFAQSLLYNL